MADGTLVTLPEDSQVPIKQNEKNRLGAKEAVLRNKAARFVETCELFDFINIG